MSVYSLFLGVGYMKQNAHYCSPYVKMSSTTTIDAKRECEQQPTCYMMFDNSGDGNDHYLCTNKASILWSSEGSILYIKDPKGKFVKLL